MCNYCGIGLSKEERLEDKLPYVSTYSRPDRYGEQSNQYGVVLPSSPRANPGQYGAGYGSSTQSPLLSSYGGSTQTRILGYNDSAPLDGSVAVIFPDYNRVAIDAKSIGEANELYAHARQNHAILQGYLSSTMGKAFTKYAKDAAGYLPAIEGIGSMKSNNPQRQTVAAAAPDLAAILLSTDFDKHAAAMSRMYGVSKDAAAAFILTHELTHHWLGIDDEKEVERTAIDFYTKQAIAAGSDAEAMEYMRLAQMSEDRLANVERVYRGNHFDAGKDSAGSGKAIDASSRFGKQQPSLDVAALLSEILNVA